MSLIAARTTLSIWSLVTDFRTAGFAGDHHFVGGGERFARRADGPGIDTRFRAFTEKQIDDLVGNPVANLVRMTLRNRLARKQILACSHFRLP